MDLRFSAVLKLLSFSGTKKITSNQGLGSSKAEQKLRPGLTTKPRSKVPNAENKTISYFLTHLVGFT